jgi:hypothetical protein
LKILPLAHQEFHRVAWDSTRGSAAKFQPDLWHGLLVLIITIIIIIIIILLSLF